MCFEPYWPTIKGTHNGVKQLLNVVIFCM